MITTPLLQCQWQLSISKNIITIIILSQSSSSWLSDSHIFLFAGQSCWEHLKHLEAQHQTWRRLSGDDDEHAEGDEDDDDDEDDEHGDEEVEDCVNLEKKANSWLDLSHTRFCQTLSFWLKELRWRWTYMIMMMIMNMIIIMMIQAKVTVVGCFPSYNNDALILVCVLMMMLVVFNFFYRTLNASTAFSCLFVFLCQCVPSPSS